MILKSCIFIGKLVIHSLYVLVEQCVFVLISEIILLYKYTTKYIENTQWNDIIKEEITE
jgi:hypothetical protein